MGDWSISGRSSRSIKYPTGDSTYYVVVDPSSANTKSSYIEVCASTPFNCAGVVFHMGSNQYESDNLFDIAIGSAGNEIDIVSNLSYSCYHFWLGESLYIPIEIPEGTRVSIRAQTSYLSNNLRVNLSFIEKSFLSKPLYSRCVTYGADTSDSMGTLVDPGASADTKGSYVEFSSSTEQDIHAIFVACLLNSDSSATTGNVSWNIDVSVGSAGSEVLIIDNITTNLNTTNDTMMPRWFPPMPIMIPKGSRLAVRTSCASASTSYRYIDIILYCLTK